MTPPNAKIRVARRNYGERRIIAIGLAEGLELTVCYTDRVDAMLARMDMPVWLEQAEAELESLGA
jgi:uncharacterized DUF497 family protein